MEKIDPEKYRHQILTMSVDGAPDSEMVTVLPISKVTLHSIRTELGIKSAKEYQTKFIRAYFIRHVVNGDETIDQAAKVLGTDGKHLYWMMR